MKDLPTSITDDANPESGKVSFTCNICDHNGVASLTELGRENPTCDKCQSTVRLRGIVHVLSTELFGRSLCLSEFPRRPDIVGVGMSDWDGYADRLASLFSYQNTFYHQEPKLDIRYIEPGLEGTMDFVISSDVFEHVTPPVSVAFRNVWRLLKAGGLLVFSVPYSTEAETVEHFPQLNDFKLLNVNGELILKNTTHAGEEQTFNELVFHGGPGSTLEMRLFSEASLLREFQQAGFHDVRIHKEANFEHGVYWQYDWSIMMSARK